MSPRRILGLAAVLMTFAMLAGACSRVGGSSAPAAQSGSGAAGIPVGSPIGNAAPLSVSVPGLGAKIVKTATISLQLPRRSFAARVQQATMVAARNGGFVADSQTTEGDQPSGSFVIRVPVAAFETTLGELHIKQVVTRPYKPRRNGKVERVFGTVERERLRAQRFRYDSHREEELHWVTEYYNL